MSDNQDEYSWGRRAQKSKEQNISQLIQKSREKQPCDADPVGLRKVLIQRTMERHGFTEEQALALLLAFGR
ncbi:hypothetical protein EYC98_06600 [Halieaceae bacterium IMCC14734]|uniref:Regulatory protein RecX n=1 Tax=Candidatus Litorirhabdus singularis TaxID=2518993 RepID=A0ABT3TE62_9GAMM|nr:hypothetical protein [Candidatus Litorirhabdus singularis]MCX2980544.1 hypothetical protein [Candidatus Litorirhabdus singularis]